MPPARGRGRGRGQRAVPGSTRGGALRRGLTSLSPVGSQGPSSEEIRVGLPNFGGTSGEAWGRGGTTTPTTATIENAVAISSSVEAVGVKRPAYGARGIPTNVFVNCFRADIPTCLIYHYNVAFLPTDKRLPCKTAMEVIRRMQEENPTIFTNQGSYDGRKNLYSPIKYSFGDEAQFEIRDPTRPTPWCISVEWIDIINPWYAARYVEGRTSHDENVLGTLDACNVAIRMQTIQKNPFNARSFFTRAEFKDIGRGVELWRGYFQSVRPTIGMMVVNVDISSAAFYKSGPLIKLCLEYLGRSPESDPLNILSTDSLEPRTRRNLVKFIRNLSVRTTGNGQSRIRPIKDISEKGADSLFFRMEGTLISLAAFFFQTTGRRLRYPTLVCVRLSQTAWVPLECCEVVPGQFFRTLSPDQTIHMVEFSRLKPQERLQNIRNGFQELGYGNSPYLQDLGMNVDPNPISIQGRILPTPTLMYGNNLTIQPHDGRWNMRQKTLYKPEKVIGYGIIIYDRRFGFNQEQHLKRSLFNTARKLGIQGMPPDPPVLRKDATGSVYWKHLQQLAIVHKAAKGTMPNLVIVVLPDMAEDILLRITNAGDIKLGVATQCLKASKCGNGNVQYYANVCLKINAKIGGINVIPKPGTVPLLGDRATRTLVIGADVQRPAPATKSRPSYTAVVGSVDSNASKYVAISKPQLGQMELINDLADMAAHVIKKYMQYRREVEDNADFAPQRILFYRKGISEGQFKECKDFEIDQIFKACDRIGIPRPKLTFVVVGRGHRIRFFPPPGGKCEKSGNAPAGLIVDRGITSPIEYDFYLQSHAGIQGTNRPAHYSVLLDQNNLTPDDLQSISFTLCHVYARSTCSVSIVAPAYYAGIVCDRARVHYDPDGGFSSYDDLDPESQILTGSDTDTYRRAFQSVHAHIGQHMYFQ